MLILIPPHLGLFLRTEMFLLGNESNYLLERHGGPPGAEEVNEREPEERRRNSQQSPQRISATLEGGRGAGSPENEALGPLLLEKLVKGSLGAGEDVRRQGGAGLPGAAEVELRHLPGRVGDRRHEKVRTSPPQDTADSLPRFKLPGKL